MEPKDCIVATVVMPTGIILRVFAELPATPREFEDIGRTIIRAVEQGKPVVLSEDYRVERVYVKAEWQPVATVPGPTFAPLTADLRAPLNEAGERIGPARERRAEAAALVARLTAGDAEDEPAVVGS